MKLKTLIFPALAMAFACGMVAANMGPANSVYDFTKKDIDGKPVKLEKFKGKVLLVVNVASKCGLTPQYDGLQKLYTSYKAKGFEVLGFPANEFGNQEPGSNKEIKEFCVAKHHVTFPMFEKIVVKGQGIDPLYEFLISHSDRPKDDIEWNFAKFLVGKDGKVIKRFNPQTKPDDAELVKAIEAALK
ncbi:MAG: glutathione peroxidase [Chlorobia bacterium]|nr:glutathione peroxidase [Fimbriimonadaceae bacterium]